MSSPRPAVIRWLIRAFPEDFKRVHGGGLADSYPGPPSSSGRSARAWYWTRAAFDLSTALVGVWWDRLPGRASHPADPRVERKVNVLDDLASDLRFAVRGLRRAPGFSIMAVLTIALGLGANTAIFSVVHGVLLRPLPYDEPTELTRVFSRFLPESGFDFEYFSVDPTEYLDLRDTNRSFESVAAYTGASATLTDSDRAAERLSGLQVTWNLFDLLGATPVAGRLLTPDDDVAGGPLVAVVSHALWEDRFGSDPGLLGRTIPLNRRAYEVVGVLPPDFGFPTPEVDLYTPLQLAADPSNRQSHYLSVIARLDEGVGLDAAAADVTRMMEQWEQAYPDIHTGHFLFLEDYRDALVSNVRPALVLLMLAVGFVLLVVCVNVANLLLVRGHSRINEVAVRRALGASRWRVIQIGLTESAVLAVVGAGLGLLLARVGLRGLLRLDDGALPSAFPVTMDGSVLAFTGLLAVITALAFGLAPALQGARRGTAGTLRDEGRSGTASRSRLRARNLLVAIEVALSFVLVIGAGLMVRSFGKLLAEDPGFVSSGALVADYSLPAAAYPTAIETERFLDAVVEGVGRLPGVTSATHVGHLPMRRGQAVLDFELEGTPEPGPGQPAWNAGVTMVRANYFETMGVRVVEGRPFDATLDRVDGVPAVVVSRSMADRFLAGGPAVGRRMRLSGSTDEQPWWTVVGVVDDVDYSSLGQEGSPMYYLLTEQIPLYNTLEGFERSGTLVVRVASGSPLGMAEPLRQAVAAADPELPLTNVARLESVVGDSIARTRFVMTLMGLLAGLALLLGAIGIYGVTSFVVSQRRQEIGIRKALGAAGPDVTSLVLRQGLAPVVLGMLVGAGAALGARGVMSGLLYGVEPSDAITYAGVALILGLVAVAALWLPARRASRLDPMVSLRDS